jgi:hypothetical protein
MCRILVLLSLLMPLLFGCANSRSSLAVQAEATADRKAGTDWVDDWETHAVARIEYRIDFK